MNVIDYIFSYRRLALGWDLGYIQMCVDSGHPDSLCGECDDRGYPTPEGMEKAQRFIARAENWTPTGWYLYGWYLTVTTVAHLVYNEIMCKYKDHDWVCEDWGGPETGGMGATCKRCGYSWSHTMY